MQDEKTNFDRYLERKLQDADFRARFEAADQAWDIALQLAVLRQARGLTQKQVAEMLGTKQQAIARLEDPAYTGHSLSMVRKYVEALGASLDVTIVPAEITSGYVAQRSPKLDRDRQQSTLDRVALWFEPWRELEAAAQLLYRLIPGKARRVGGDFE